VTGVWVGPADAEPDSPQRALPLSSQAQGVEQGHVHVRGPRQLCPPQVDGGERGVRARGTQHFPRARPHEAHERVRVWLGEQLRDARARGRHRLGAHVCQVAGKDADAVPRDGKEDVGGSLVVPACPQRPHEGGGCRPGVARL